MLPIKIKPTIDLAVGSMACAG